jgi:hypothetical protein
MHDSGWRRWWKMGALVSASWLVVACSRLPQQPGNESFRPGLVRETPAQAGYNGTIQDLKSSIDPRTPDKEGTPGRSLPMDPGERALMEQQQGLGGSGSGAGQGAGIKYGSESGIGDMETAPSKQAPASQTTADEGPAQRGSAGGPPGKGRARNR